MERLSNKYEDLVDALKKELSCLNIEKHEICLLYYAEIPWFAGGQFSLFLLYNTLTDGYCVVEKRWDSQYDCQRFLTGIYNLDRLCIKTNINELSNSQKEQIESIIKRTDEMPDTLESTGYILLDGIEYELKIKTNLIDKQYKWKLANENIAYIKPLIDFLLKYVTV